MLAHTAYLEKLNTLNDYAREWPSVAAGFLVLRLVDAWFREGADVIRRDTAGVEAVRQAIRRLAGSDPVRPILSEIVDVAEQSDVAIVQWVAPYLWRYGTLLERQGQWGCAHDVFCSTRQHAQAGGDPWLTMWSALRAGPLARHLADFDAADMTLAVAAQAAQQVNHTEGHLRARLGVANNILARHGNLSQANAMVRSIEAEARLYCSSTFVSIVLHQLACFSFVKRDYYTAIKLGTAAQQSTDDLDERYRIKGHTAASLACLGHIEAARKINLSILTRAREEYIRQNALLNLLELASRDKNKPLFERYRQELTDAPLPARNRAVFHLFAGQGLHVFGQAPAAQVELHHALAITTEYRLTDILPVIRANLYNRIGRPTSTVI